MVAPWTRLTAGMRWIAERRMQHSWAIAPETRSQAYGEGLRMQTVLMVFMVFMVFMVAPSPADTAADTAADATSLGDRTLDMCSPRPV